MNSRYEHIISALSKPSRKTLIDNIQKQREIRSDMLRRAIVIDGRMDILVKTILGLDLTPYHINAINHQRTHEQSLILAYRGFGKTTTLTIPGIVMDLLEDNNCTILLGGKTHSFTKKILLDVKRKLMSPKFVEVFGKWRGDKWDENEINVSVRTKFNHVPSVSTVGVDSQVVGSHYDKHRIDDLLDEKSSRTTHQRELARIFYYKELYPTLLPKGKRYIVGTRWHPEDVYGHLANHEYKDTTLVIPALISEKAFDDNGNEILKYSTPWPERRSVEFFLEHKRVMPPSIFNTQYQCSIDAMIGDLYLPEWFDDELCYYRDDELTVDARYYQGVDLAISTDGNYFVIVTIAVHGSTVYFVDCWKGRLSFYQQRKKIYEYWKEFDERNLVAVGIEVNAYQKSQMSEVVRVHPEIAAVPIHTSIDKVTKAQRLSEFVEQRRLLFKRDHVSSRMIDALLSLRKDGKTGEWDMFDALYFAVYCAFRSKKRRSRRKHPPGLITSYR